MEFTILGVRIEIGKAGEIRSVQNLKKLKDKDIVDEFLTVKQIAEILKYMPATIRKQIYHGKLKAIKIEHKFLISREEFDKYLKGHKFKKIDKTYGY